LGYVKSFWTFQHSTTKENQIVANKIKSSQALNLQLSGLRYETGTFNESNNSGNWWTSQWSGDNTWNPNLNKSKADINPSNLGVNEYFISGPGAGMLSAGCGFSIRCIKGSLNRTLKIPIIKNEFIELGEDGKPLNGIYTWGKSDGNVTRTFINGIENGKRLSYDRSNYLVSEENYKDGVLNGLSSYYSYYGKHIIKEGNYLDGEK